MKRKIIISGGVCTIPLTRGLFAICDSSEYESVVGFNWSAQKCSNGNFYAKRRCSKTGGTILMHRLISNGNTIDHINGNGLDNRKCNLRACTDSQNIANSRICKRNKSGFKGVYFHKKANKWTSQIMFNRKSLHLGLFDSALEASSAYQDKANELFGEFANSGMKK